MAYVMKKRHRYLTGHSYATGLGYSFHWSADIGEALRIPDDCPQTDFYQQRTGARIVHVENMRKELKALGKRAIAAAPKLSGD